jgi:hypothetical protein
MYILQVHGTLTNAVDAMQGFTCSDRCSSRQKYLTEVFKVGVESFQSVKVEI